MKFKFYNVGASSYLEAFFDSDDLVESNRLEGAGHSIRNRNPLVFFDKNFRSIHPDVLGLVCLSIFYPFVGKRVEFPEAVSPRLVESINREIFTKHKKIDILNVDHSLERYSGDGSSVTAFGGGMDSSAIRALFPETFLVHEASIRNGEVVPDYTSELFEGFERDGNGSLVTTNSRFISDPGGWHVWVGSTVTSALTAAAMGASYIFTGTILGSAFLKNGTGYFDRHASRKWHGESGNYWQQLFWDIGLPMVSPLMGCSEILSMKISLDRLEKSEVVYCTYDNGRACGVCPKCFRRACIEDYLCPAGIDFSRFDNKAVNSLLDIKPTYFGHIYAALISSGWSAPSWAVEKLDHLPKDVSFPLKYFSESLDFIPGELRDVVKSRLDTVSSPMSSGEVDGMKNWLSRG